MVALESHSSPRAPSFLDRLRAAQAATGACLCVGLDPEPERLPAPFRGRPAAEAIRGFCFAITASTAPHACAFKPNLAFFEALGTGGWEALAAVCEAVRATGRLLILDGKRGDIGNTARRYADALYEGLGGDAATVAPYMGRDAIAPFLQHPGRCAFVLAATSNPGAADLQMLDVEGEPLYRRVARMAVEAGERQPGEAGLVVGATRPEVLGALRADFPSVPLLVPGVGAQGGRPAEVLEKNAGGPILINASRSILYASSDADFAEAAAREAERLARTLAV